MILNDFLEQIIKDYLKNTEYLWTLGIESGLLFWELLFFTSFCIIFYWYESIPKIGVDNISEIIYPKLKFPSCPKCEDPLFQDDPGVWYCENSECNYTEYNNITICQSDGGCNNLVLSKNLKFDSFEESYCNIPSPEGITCLGYAYAEYESFIQENYELEEHMKNCSDERCDCRNV